MKKPEGCKSCPLLVKGEGFVRPVIRLTDGNQTIKLLVQGEAPGRSEIEAGQPFVGPAGFWLRRNILKNAGVEEHEVVFDNTIRCLLNGESGEYPARKERKEAEECCDQYSVWNQFPSSIPLLLTGSKAIGRYLENDKVSQWHGHIGFVAGRITGCTYHPAAVMRNPNLLPLAVQEVRNLLKAARNPSLLERPKVKKGYIIQRPANFVFDLEWDVETGQLIVVGIAYSGEEAYSSFDVGYADWIDHALFKTDVQVGGHNIIDADLPILGYTPEQIRDKADQLFDTMIAAHLVHPHFAELGLYGLSDMVKYYEPTSEWKHLKEDILLYNGWDNAYTARLRDHLKRDLIYTKQDHLLAEQQKLAAMALAMKQRGVRIDTKALEEYARERKAEREEIAKSLPINPNSWQQIKKWAKEEFKISLRDTTIETLKKYEGRFEEFDKLIEYREDSKSLKTWFPLEEDEDGNVYCAEEWAIPSYKTTGTSVDRPSCADPNLLNVPEGGPRQMSDGRVRELPNLRRFFIPRDKDLRLVSYDFSSIEHRTVAYCAGDKKKLADLDSGIKTYTVVAAEYFKKRYDEVTKDEYRFGKTTVLATDYCESPYNLATRLRGRRDAKALAEARGLQAAYFRAYPATRAFQDRIAKQLDSGSVTLRNPFGRVRKVYAQDSHERQKRGVHFMGCSTATRIVNRKAIKVWEELGLVPLFWVYDELCYELPYGEVGDRLALRIEEILLEPVPELEGLVIPVSVKQGPNYGTLKEWDLNTIRRAA